MVWLVCVYLSKNIKGVLKMETESKNRLLKGHEVAQILNISRALAYRMMQRGDIKVVKFGKSVRVSERDLQEFINKHKLADN